MSGGFLAFLYSQLFVTLPVPDTSLAGKTVIVTGSNVGLGKEAARHFARLGASSIILAVRSLEKGDRAKAEIEASSGCGNDVIKVWQLDMSSYQSVQDFAEKVDRELPRLDVALLNAGIATMQWNMAEQDESTITVNVVSTFLLAYLLLPKLKESAQKFNIRPNLTITASEVHAWCKFEERKTADGNIFKNMSDERWSKDMDERYHVSKLLDVLGVRAMANRRSASQIPVTINCVNPGFCFS
jgi:NAD(P)-dependent dehydrogenase (short-subunit alcohol dehydrogenase family)